MIRGKAMEYNAYLLLDKLLPRNTWSVQKLNLNPQPGTYDEDISITHRKTGIILKVESKSAVRASISTGKRTRKVNVPKFNVKCHRSRSNIKLAGSSNDRYSVDSFDVLMTNPSNAIFKGNTIGEHLELVSDKETLAMLFDFYQVNSEKDLVAAAENDWRFCIPQDIAEEGFIPRTPLVLLTGDPNWQTMEHLEKRLLRVVEEKHKNPQTTRRS
jgi:hypothetical protein